jgi:hypothetical protein
MKHIKDTPLRDKEDYREKLKVIHKLLRDREIMKDSELARVVQARLIRLNATAKAAGYI